MAELSDPRHADKLDNPERLVESRPAVVVEPLRLSGAEACVDVGAGIGMYSFPLTGAVHLRGAVSVMEKPRP